MANVPETPTWESGIYQFEITDPVIGGPDGLDNLPSKQLANRTLFLKQKQESTDTSVSGMNGRLGNAETSIASQATRITNAENKANGMQSGSVPFNTQPRNASNTAAANTEFVMQNRGGLSGLYQSNDNVVIGALMAGKLIHTGAASSLTMTVADNAVFKEGDVLTFVKTEAGVLRINLTNTAATVDGFKSVIYLYAGEMLELLKLGGFWVVKESVNIFANIGLVVSAHVLRPGYLELNGAVVSRAAYPRLWEYAQLTNIIADGSWNLTNKGKFSSGDGSTTFRLPDFRDVFTRSKGTAREVGSYQSDEIISHQHGGIPGNQSGPYNQIGTGAGSLFQLNGTGYTNFYGAEETRPKNIALIQMIKY